MSFWCNFRLPVQNVLLPEMDDCSVLTASTGKMLNILTDENKKLREDLNNYHRKVAILQKVCIFRIRYWKAMIN